MITRSKLILVGTGLAVAVPALAVFGLGDIVYDPWNEWQNIEAVFHAEATVKQVTGHYDHAKKMAQWIQDIPKRYYAAASSWRGLVLDAAAPPASGTWATAANSGDPVEVGKAWRLNTLPLPTLSEVTQNLPLPHVAHVAQQVASVALQDGVGRTVLMTVGEIRAIGARRGAVLKDLDDDIRSVKPEMQTDTANFNKLNVGTALVASTAADTNKLLTNLAEIELLRITSERNALVRALAIEQQVRSGAAAAMNSLHQGDDAALRSFRFW